MDRPNNSWEWEEGWRAPWLEGQKPIEIAPLIFATSKRNNWKVSQALYEEAWVRKIVLDSSFHMEHLSQFVDLWTLFSTT
jgi:hypothetical protein